MCRAQYACCGVHSCIVVGQAPSRMLGMLPGGPLGDVMGGMFPHTIETDYHGGSEGRRRQVKNKRSTFFLNRYYIVLYHFLVRLTGWSTRARSCVLIFFVILTRKDRRGCYSPSCGHFLRCSLYGAVCVKVLFLGIFL